MVENKYKLPVSKNDISVYVVNIPKVIEILKEKYEIKERNSIHS
jgi:hypothetical protein